jgi:hypothetical protein
MTLIDLTQMSTDDLINLILAQAQQVAKLQAEIDELSMKVDKGKKLPTISVNLSQPPSNEQKGNTIDKRKRHKHGPPQEYPSHEISLALQPERIIDIKPKWLTKNRLQNCHKPKPK